ncbi:hypothetical protein AAVH_03205 [Aphelenchoides avenae]|nr:hypothetical protein AAVH_03205 [Aphelenchus avenae]
MGGQAERETNHDDHVQRNELTLPAMLITLHVVAFMPLTIAFLVGYAAGYVNVGLLIVGMMQLLYAVPGFQDHNETAWLYTYSVAQVLLGVMELAWSVYAFVEGNPIGVGVVLILLSLVQFAMAFIAIQYRDFAVSDRYATAYESMRRRKKAWSSENRNTTAAAATATKGRDAKGSGHEIVDELPVPLVVQKRDLKTRKANNAAELSNSVSQASTKTQQHSQLEEGAVVYVDSASPSLCAPPGVKPPVTGSCKPQEQHKSFQRKPLVRMKPIREESCTKNVPAGPCAPIVVEKRTYTWTKSSPLSAQNAEKQLPVPCNNQQNAAMPAFPTTVIYAEDEEEVAVVNDEDFTLTTYDANLNETAKTSAAEPVVNAMARPEPSIFQQIFGQSTSVPEANKKRIPTPLPSFSKLPATTLVGQPNNLPPKPKEKASIASKPLTLNPVALAKKDAESSESCDCDDCKAPRKKRYYFVRKTDLDKKQPANDLKTVATMSSST